MMVQSRDPQPRNDREPFNPFSTAGWMWLAGAVFLALAPLGETPHLYQKVELLVYGWLKKPMDWFDLALHGLPILSWLVLAGYRLVQASRTEKN
jgi:hypothetical protein